MLERRKIIIVGPPGTGKTTLKKIFFEMGNPFNLLKNSLKPSRGKDSSVYTLFDLDLGVFDLAGQENANWFNRDIDVFSQANIIIVVLDINSYVQDIFNFFEQLTKIHNELNLSDAQVIILLHKIDLIDSLYLQHKLKAINDYLDEKKEPNFNGKIYTTSIAKEFFLKTYDIVTEILTSIFPKKSEFRNDSLIKDFKTDLEIVINYDVLKDYSPIDLFYDFKLSLEKANIHLTRLKHLGFIKFLENSQNFQLTDRASFFKHGQENILDEKQYKINKILESLYLFSNLIPKMDKMSAS